MPVTGEAASSVSWWTVVASSALTSAGVNVGWNAFSKWLDRRRENAKEKQRVDHVKLEIMDQLESFANRCASFMSDIDEGLGRHYQHDQDAFSNVQRSLALKFDPEPQWTELPVKFVAPLKALVREYGDTGEWISRADLWADVAEQYEYELERLAYYGLEVLDIADTIRVDIKAGERGTVQLEASRLEFTRLIEKRFEAYQKRPCDTSFIPELEAQFENELPGLKARQRRLQTAQQAIEAEGPPGL
jgi:hypothetical protein